MNPDNQLVKILAPVDHGIQKQGVNMAIIGRLQAIKEMAPAETDIAEEEKFVEQFERFTQARAERENQQKAAAARKIQALEAIQGKVEAQKKEEAEKMDADFAKLLSVEEQQSLEEGRKKQEEIQRKDDLAFGIVKDFPHIDF